MYREHAYFATFIVILSEAKKSYEEIPRVLLRTIRMTARRGVLSFCFLVQGVLVTKLAEFGGFQLFLFHALLST